MIRYNNKNLLAINFGSKPIIAIYYKREKIWPSINNDIIESCFSNGYWIDDYPWIDDLPWKD